MLTATPARATRIVTRSELTLIVASSFGALLEWYDFYIYAALAATFSTLFFPSGNATAAFLASLATFGAGFLVRPLGALFFGRLGDRIGRKYTFMATIVLMGVATVGAGCCRPMRTSSLQRRCCWCCSGCCRGSRWAGRPAAPRPILPSMRPTVAAGSIRAHCRPPRRSACCRRLPSWARRGRSWDTMRSRYGDGACRSWSRWSCSRFPSTCARVSPNRRRSSG
ncbi:membrane hypothetical protein [Burkholderia cepacia]